ncbi:NupC/NupG family nucleoside CNT transporter [Sphingomonas desiccabilis]|uniref:NupC/NupG family nucleoside CNT transporter n=1 Tax=Sphingomonas desiccabilis TaxID=429134 RepID=A0A4Q2ITQ8_9SPHN|nr:NupC/NupG family nucleoside CNT transporter [Sphingomonas desiccabilis]MBB3911435.1 CNT family concentrative nucleoside transporter [Sphingomonas desiccabilis]RXZ31791.1 NupC/NupG family nucleoside CNT transporter [Sphingomonas desiccabilis]
MNRFLIGVAGIVVILAIAFAISTNRRAIRLRVVGAAFALQVGIAVLVLYVPFGRRLIQGAAAGVSALLGYAQAGTDFVFGPLARPEMGGHSFAISALPVIIFFAALVSILYHLGVMQFVVRWVGGGIEKVTGVSKVESLCAAANIFVGQSEAPLVIRPYLASLTPSQLFAVMSVGMAGVAGTILAAYAAFLGPQSLPFLLAASFMAAPGGLLMAKIIMPDAPVAAKDATAAADEEETIREAEVHLEEERAANLIMAAATGAQIGVKIAVAVGAMVLAFVALVALANGLLGAVGGWFGHPELSFQMIIGTVFQPVMFLLNIPWHEAGIAGGLFGSKVVLNEFVSFIELGNLRDQLSPRTVAIVTFALCGFANFSSIAIQMAATGSLAPNQRPMIAKLGVRALVAGSLANLMSAALAGLLLS